MKFTTIIVLLIPVVGARHHHRTLLETILKSKGNLFTKVDNDVQNVMNNIFDLLNLDANFLAKSRVKLLLTMHYDLRNIAEKNYDVYAKMKDSAKPETVNKTEDTIDLYDLIEEILNDKPSNLSDKTIETKIRHKHSKPKIQINDSNESISDFADSKEFMQFIRDFIKKVDNLSEKDFTKPSSMLSTDEQNNNYTESNLKVWQPPRVLELDYVNDTNGRRIFKGKKTRVKSYPFIVSVHLMGTFTCAGSLISKDLVITAASCLQLLYNNRFYRENPRALFVRVGSDYFIKGGEIIQVIETYFHPSYDPKSLANNLVILRLMRHIKFMRTQKKIRRILIDRNASKLSDNTDGIIVVGWGPKSPTHIIDQWQRMLVSQLDIYPLDECSEIYSRVYVTAKNYCAGFISKGGGACNKDLGGPGIVGGKLVGVISFGAPICGAIDSPTVFTKLGYYTEWIDGIINEETLVIGMGTTLQTLISRPPFFDAPDPRGLITPHTTTEAHTEAYSETYGEDYNAYEQLDPDIITLKTVLHDLADSNSTFLTELLYGDYQYPDEDFHNMFKPTEKLDPKQHPLVNKSIFAIPGLHDIPTAETTEYVTIALTTASTRLPDPFADPIEPTTIPPSREPQTTSEEHFTDLARLLRSGNDTDNDQNNDNNVLESGEDTVIYYESYEDTTPATTISMFTKPYSAHRNHHRQRHHHKNKISVDRATGYASDYYADELEARAVRDYDDEDYFGMQISK